MNIFVYGNLMEGFGNYNKYLKGRVLYRTEGEARGKLYHLPAGYPAMIDGDDVIKGEIMEIKDEDIKILDELEGYYGENKHNLYDRFKREVKTAENGSFMCWIYFYRNIDYVKTCGIYIPHGN
ncbi:MAG: gamma-glutamylcyclotransferase family protein [Candidatus Eremiobacterota bacterium]